MAAPPSAYQDRHFLAVIGDEVGPTSSESYRRIRQLTSPIGLGDWSATGRRRSMECHLLTQMHCMLNYSCTACYPTAGCTEELPCRRRQNRQPNH